MWIIPAVALLLAIALVIFLAVSGKLISLEYADFPREELEKLISEAPAGEPVLSGPEEVELSSPWTRWAMKLLPGTFLVKVKINGHKASLVVDSGASGTYLSPEVAIAARLILTNSRFTSHHGGREVPVYAGWVQEMKLGELRIQGLPVFVGGNQPVVKLLGLPIWKLDGLLGMEPLQRLALTLEYERGLVVFRRRPLLLQAPSVPLRIHRNRTTEGLENLWPLVDCFIGDSGPFSCLIDTGTSGPVQVPSAVWHALGLGEERQARLQIQLGEIELVNVPCVIAPGLYPLIGSNIFQAQGIKRLTLDFLGGKLYAER